MKKIIILCFLFLCSNSLFPQKGQAVKAALKYATKKASKETIINTSKKKYTIFFVNSLTLPKKKLSPEASNLFLSKIFSKKKAARIFKKLGNQKINEIYNFLPNNSDEKLKKIFLHDVSTDDAFANYILKNPSILNCCYSKLITTGPIYRRNLSLLKKIKDGKSPVLLKTINNEYENKYLNGVLFKLRKRTLDSGLEVKVIVPQFKKHSIFEVKIPNHHIMKRDLNQMTLAFMKFRKNLIANPELQKKFTKEQLQEILHRKLSLSENTYNVPGYIWHHTEDRSLQLVKKDLHDLVKHSGGRTIFGGGSTMR
jgi:hypothetical protein